MDELLNGVTETQLIRAWSYYLTGGTNDPDAAKAATDYLNAVRAEARKAERRRLWHVIDPLVHGSTLTQIVESLRSADLAATVENAYSLGVSTALMETLREVPDE